MACSIRVVSETRVVSEQSAGLIMMLFLCVSQNSNFKTWSCRSDTSIHILYIKYKPGRCAVRTRQGLLEIEKEASKSCCARHNPGKIGRRHL